MRAESFGGDFYYFAKVLSPLSVSSLRGEPILRIKLMFLKLDGGLLSNPFGFCMQSGFARFFRGIFRMWISFDLFSLILDHTFKEIFGRITCSEGVNQ